MQAPEKATSFCRWFYEAYLVSLALLLPIPHSNPQPSSDMTHYTTYITSLRNADLLTYFKALIELAQIYLIAPEDAKDMATVIADGDRFYGVFRAEEVYEFAQRRADWYQVKSKVERAMYGIGCIVM